MSVVSLASRGPNPTPNATATNQEINLVIKISFRIFFEKIQIDKIKIQKEKNVWRNWIQKWRRIFDPTKSLPKSYQILKYREMCWNTEQSARSC